MTEDLSAQVKFTWRYLLDLLTGSCPAGVLSMVPTTGETVDAWWDRQIQAGRGGEAQRMLEAEFIRLYEMGMLSSLTTFIPVRRDVPPSSDLYRSRFGERFVYLTDPQSLLSEPVKHELEYEIEALLAERVAFLNDVDVDEYPGNRALWWVVPGKTIQAAAADETKEWVLQNLRNKAAKALVELMCVDELSEQETELAFRYGISLVGGSQEFVEDILADDNESPFGLDPGESPFSLMPREEDDGLDEWLSGLEEPEHA